nr:sugar phosphate nucleotidyltransferase [Micromonospora sp. NBRC 107566]
MPDLCAIVLAAGEGTRLRPLTARLPKALCPVGNVPLLDLALARVAALGASEVAVNAAYLGDLVAAHVDERTAGRVHVSYEADGPLGTSGGVGRLREWVGGRPVLVANADAYLAGGSVTDLLRGWDGEGVRLLGVRGGRQEFGPYQFAGVSLLPWRYVRRLTDEHAELVSTVWRPAERAGGLSVVEYAGTFIDTGTPRDYLRANLHAAGGGSLIADGADVTGPVERCVIGAGAVVRGSVTASVVWPGAVVAPGERLTGAVRAGTDLTVAAAEGLA